MMLMTITNIVYKEGFYTITYTNNETNKEFKLHGFCEVRLDRQLPEEFINTLHKTDFINNLNDSFWLDSEEYLVVIPKTYEVGPSDESFLVGIIRHYFQNHMDETYKLYFHSLGTIMESDIHFDMEEFKLALFKYINWDA